MRGDGWAVFGVIVIVFVAVAIVSILVGVAASGLGSVGRALVHWAVDAAIAPVTALSASVLYFALPRQQGDATASRPSADRRLNLPGTRRGADALRHVARGELLGWVRSSR